jgi:tetratricopeptide (TPR) repeat protein
VSAKRSRKAARETRSVPRVGSTNSPGSQHRQTITRLVPIVIALVIVVAYLPTLQNGFVDFDDDKALLENLRYRGLGWSNLSWMFTTTYMGPYQPLSWASLAIDYLAWGMWPAGYHLTSLLIHALNGVLFYCVARELFALAGGRTRASELCLSLAAGCSALLFAVHPLRVESVAWATERRDVLSGLFFLVTILAYLRAHSGLATDAARRRWTVVAVASYMVSLLSKASAMTLPLILVMLDVYPLGRLSLRSVSWADARARTVWAEKVLFLVPALVFGFVAFVGQKQSGAMKPFVGGVSSRIAQASFGVVFYVWKTVVPVRLAPLYEDPGWLNLFTWPYWFFCALVLAVTAGVFVARNRWPFAMASWMYYLVTLVPVLGITQSGPQLAADRYSYLSCMPWPLLGGAWVLDGLQRSNRNTPAALLTFGRTIVVGTVAVILGIFTWNQVKTWHDSETLWRHAIAVGQESTIARYDLGLALAKRGNEQEAIENFRRTLEIRPSYVKARQSLGLALQKRGEFAEALKHLRQVAESSPADPKAQLNLGIVLVSTGNRDEATAHFREALRLDPKLAAARSNLAIILDQRGQEGEADEQYREALRIDPSLSDARNNLALLLAKRGRSAEAIAQFRSILQIDPGYVRARNNLGAVLADQGRLDDAIDQYREAIKSRPEYATGYLNLGVVLAKQGRLNEAVENYRRALEIEPGLAQARDNLNHALAQQAREDGAKR